MSKRDSDSCHAFNRNHEQLYIFNWVKQNTIKNTKTPKKMAAKEMP